MYRAALLQYAGTYLFDVALGFADMVLVLVVDSTFVRQKQ